MFRFGDVIDEGDSREVRRAKIHAYYRDVAVSKGGALLSKEYTTAHGRYRWRCVLGHEWVATANSVRQGSWCDECAKVQRAKTRMGDVFTRAKVTARLRGGRCVSAEYHGTQSHLDWRCRKGHVWSAVPGSVLGGTWCPVCAGTQRLSIEQIQQDARARGGELLSAEYRNGRELLRWRCAERHEFEMSAGNVRQDHWCPVCVGCAPLTLDDLRADAAARASRAHAWT